MPTLQFMVVRTLAPAQSLMVASASKCLMPTPLLTFVRALEAAQPRRIASASKCFQVVLK
jgi:hypothetical protein